MKLIPYDKSWIQKIEKIDASAAQALKYNQDVLLDTAILAVENSNLLAYGYISCGTLNYGLFSLYAEFGVNNHEETALDAVEVIIEQLKASYKEVRSRYPFDRCALVVWAEESRTEYIEFLKEMGFHPDEKMVLLEGDLLTMPVLEDVDPELTVSVGNKTAVFRELPMDRDDVMEKYSLANGKGFGVPNSVDGLRFRIVHWKARVFAFVIENENGQIDEVLCAVTVWPRRNGRCATEDIFCIPEYRRQHLTQKLLERVLVLLKKEGFKYPGMNAYLRNHEALSLYEKLGYERKGMLESYIYEQ